MLYSTDAVYGLYSRCSLYVVFKIQSIDHTLFPWIYPKQSTCTIWKKISFYQWSNINSYLSSIINVAKEYTMLQQYFCGPAAWVNDEVEFDVIHNWFPSMWLLLIRVLKGGRSNIWGAVHDLVYHYFGTFTLHDAISNYDSLILLPWFFLFVVLGIKCTTWASRITFPKSSIFPLHTFPVIVVVVIHYAYIDSGTLWSTEVVAIARAAGHSTKAYSLVACMVIAVSLATSHIGGL